MGKGWLVKGLTEEVWGGKWKVERKVERRGEITDNGPRELEFGKPYV